MNHNSFSIRNTGQSFDMIQFAVTVSLVEQARGGPFVYWDGVRTAFHDAKKLGYDAVEIFAPSADFVDRQELHKLVEETGLKVAAVGTGAGMVVHQLQLCDADTSRREQAIQFIKDIIDFGAEFNAPAIIGSMQGRFDKAEGKAAAIMRLTEALNILGEYAGQKNVPLIYEPLNRYETNLFNKLADAAEYLRSEKIANVVLLADLFHMNIEEADIAQAFRDAGELTGHIHFVDSNRQAAGFGHMDFGPIVKALKEIGYSNYVSAEAFPIPDSTTCAKQTIEKYRELFPR